MPKHEKEIHKNMVVHLFEREVEWENWLSSNHKQEEGVWLKYAKKGSGKSSLTYEESREVAIRFGWIDGLINKLDDDFYLRKFTQRRPRSKWSKINRTIAEQLIADKKMNPAGIVQVKAAMKDGRWDAAYDSPSTMEVPPALQKMLDKHPAAKSSSRRSAVQTAMPFFTGSKTQNAKKRNKGTSIRQSRC